MTTLSILIIGLFAGLLIALLVGSTALLSYIAWRVHHETQSSSAASRRAINQSTIAIDRMRGEVALALSSMDANRLHDASVTVQHSVKQLQHTVASLGQLIFKAGVSDGGMGLDPTLNEPYYETPPANPGFVHPHSPDPFLDWQRRRNQEESMKRGPAHDILPVTQLPDMQQPDGTPIDDSLDSLYVDAIIERRGNDDLPGVTEGSDSAPRP